MDQVTTTLKRTDKPITDVAFPAVTICSAGLHMGNVEKKVTENFMKWSEEKHETREDLQAIRHQMMQYMRQTFQIEPPDEVGRNPVNILDILDTMVAPNVEASVALNGVQANALACTDPEVENDKTERKKRAAWSQTHVCTNSQFLPSPGGTCFFFSSDKANYTKAVEECKALGATLAKISDATENDLVLSMKNKNSWAFIGLTDTTKGRDVGSFVWEDGSKPSYDNWSPGAPASGKVKDCAVMSFSSDNSPGQWFDFWCSSEIMFVCSMSNSTVPISSSVSPTTTTTPTTSTTTTSITTTPTSTTTTSTTSTSTTSTSTTTTKTATANSSDVIIAQEVKSLLNQRTCIKPQSIAKNSNETARSTLKLPNIDIFLNPNKKEHKDNIIRIKQSLAKEYFSSSDMVTLYPELFRVLWESTLPCFGENSMLLSCEVAGSLVNCSDIFKRVPTDRGICCALNSDNSLKESEYLGLIKSLQGNTKSKRVRSKAGRNNGLTLTLDLHTNTVSFGTLDQRHLGFSIFIGQPSEFPAMTERSLQLQPGQEHFVDLSATVVSAKDIEGIEPNARGCYFGDEGSLEFYAKYTFSNCRLECRIKRAEKEIGCIPWHLPKVEYFC